MPSFMSVLEERLRLDAAKHGLLEVDILHILADVQHCLGPVELTGPLAKLQDQLVRRRPVSILAVVNWYAEYGLPDPRVNSGHTRNPSP